MAKNKNKIHRRAVYINSDFRCVYCKLKFSVPYNWDYRERQQSRNIPQNLTPNN